MVDYTRGRIQEDYRRALEEPEVFWREKAETLVWKRLWHTVFEPVEGSPILNWYVGGEISICYNCLDRHVDNGDGDKIALIYESPLPDTTVKFTYAQLLDQVSRMAGFLSSLGIGQGDVVLIHVPNIVEGVVAMLATVRLGAIHSVVLGGYAANSITKILGHCKARVVITINAGYDAGRVLSYKSVMEEAIEKCDHKPDHCIVVQRPQFDPAPLIEGRDITWAEAMARAQPHDCVAIDSRSIAFIAYSSGSTGEPKAIVNPVGGVAVVFKYFCEYHNLHPGDTIWSLSSLGWALGHIGIVYGPLLSGITAVIFDASVVGTPDPTSYFRIVSDHGVNMVLACIALLRTIRLQNENAGLHDKPSKLRFLSAGGEKPDSALVGWIEKAFRAPTFDCWGQTESGSLLASTYCGSDCLTQPKQTGTGIPFTGYRFVILRADLTEADVGEHGNIMIKLPILCPSFLFSLYKESGRLQKEYFDRNPGYYDTKDVGFIDDKGCIHVLGRSDDVIKVSGHRLSTIAVEVAIAQHPEVGEAVVGGLPHENSYEIPVALYVKRAGSTVKSSTVSAELVKAVQEAIGEAILFKHSVCVTELPKTAVGKLARSTVRKVLREQFTPVKGSDEQVLNTIRSVLTQNGYTVVD